ncbi:MAG: hypothetical protein QNJ46_31770 [Leptolyngbyaceae cyanobacterium MO_188.B28]|nr:hypothetical protein [Leptolyngbyaceae cyanobacterium MO_188.B28]
MSEEMLWIITDDTKGASEPQRGYREVSQERGVQVSVSALEQKMSRFLRSVGRLFHQAEQQAAYASGMQLDEIELSVEISGEGEIKLMGSGGKAGGSGAITLRFKRLENGSLT